MEHIASRSRLGNSRHARRGVRNARTRTIPIRGAACRTAVDDAETADRLLRFLGEAPIGPVFRREVEAFLDVTAIRPAKLGTEAAGYLWFVGTLEEGGSARLSAVERVRAWMVEAATPSSALPSPGCWRTAAAHYSTTAQAPPRRARGERERPLRRQTRTRMPATMLPGSPPVVPRYERSGDVPQACQAHSRALPCGPRGPCVLQDWKSGVYARAHLLTWAWTQRVNTD